MHYLLQVGTTKQEVRTGPPYRCPSSSCLMGTNCVQVLGPTGDNAVLACVIPQCGLLQYSDFCRMSMVQLACDLLGQLSISPAGL